jgi:ABC-type transport system substrate-binding protein
VESWRVVDDYTFEITIKEYQRAWIYQLTGHPWGPLGAVISPTAYETNGEEWANWHPVGTGPFKFKDFEQDVSLEMERNDDYWGGKTLLDGVKYIYIVDEVTGQIAFEAGQADVVQTGWKSVNMMAELRDKGFKGDYYSGANIILVPSGAKPDSPLSNVKVRQAVEYAIDKEIIVEVLYHGIPEARFQCATAIQVPFDPDFVGRRYDPDKARELLTEAGFPNGFETTLYIGVHIGGNFEEMLQANLADVGITAKIEKITAAKWIDMETNGWDDGLLASVQGACPFDVFLTRFFVRPSGPNWSAGLWWDTLYRPDELETLLQEYLVIPEDKTAEILAKGREIVQLVYDEAIYINLWEHAGCEILQPYVMDTQFGTRTGGSFNFLGAWLDK